MNRRTKLLTALGAATAFAAGGVGIAQAVGGNSDDVQATGSAADRAKAEALKTVGGGRVTSVERESEPGSAWEVEIVRADGSEVEANLDSAYRSTGTERDDDDDERDDNDEGVDDDD